LNTASDELGTLQTDIHGFGSTLEGASDTIRNSVTKIDTSVTTMSSAVENIEEASLQVNSLLFPIVGAIAVILALQITILARRR
jgi:methyl-accepting chemotaxis protein